MKLLVAPDKFRGTLSASEAATALSEPLEAMGHEVRTLPLADGGEGTLEALGGSNRTDRVTGPLGDPVDARWRLRRRRAVIEMAAASGIALVGGAEHNDPLAASTRGTGELIALAIESGARDIVVGVGGSASTDGGQGAIEALFPISRVKGVDLRVACDVRTKFLDAAVVFAPQKGASPKQVEFLQRRLESLAGSYVEQYGIDVSELEGSGAAGGLAGGLAALGATLEGGFDLVAEHVGLDEHIEWADAVITGEGILDAESFDGKTVGGVQEMADTAGVTVLAVVGAAYDGAQERLPTVSLTDRYGNEAALEDAASCISDSAGAVLELLG